MVNRDLSDAKYSAAAATSSASPARFIGTRAIISPKPAICSGVRPIFPPIGVLIGQVASEAVNFRLCDFKVAMLSELWSTWAHDSGKAHNHIEVQNRSE